MEDWETKMRKDLDASVEAKMYKIGPKERQIWTGKYGYINYQILLEKHKRAGTDLHETLKPNLKSYVIGEQEDKSLMKKIKDFFKSLGNG